MLKGQLLFGNYGLTNRLTCSDSRSPCIFLIFDINWPFGGFTEASSWINFGEWASSLPQILFFALLVDTTQTCSALLLSAKHKKNETFWGKVMKMENNSKKTSFSIMILLRLYQSPASILHKIYENTFKLYSFFLRLRSSIIGPVNFNTFLPILFLQKIK